MSDREQQPTISRRLALKLLGAAALLPFTGCRQLPDTPPTESTPQTVNRILLLPTATDTPVASLTPPPAPTARPTETNTSTPVTVQPSEAQSTPLPASSRPSQVKGLYLPFDYLRSTQRLTQFQDRLLRIGANCAVIDIKSDGGQVAIPFQHDLQPEIAQQEAFPGLVDLLDWLAQHEIYAVARQVVMVDTALAEVHPWLALHYPDKRQTDNSGHIWLNPQEPQIADYNAAIAASAVQIGFREIQLDYIRFAESDFTIPFDERVGALVSVISRIRAEILGNALLTIDVLGVTTDDEADQVSDGGFGQHIPTLARFVDGICPMLYPDLHSEGIDIDYYQYVFESTRRTAEKIVQGESNTFINPWIQGYYPADRAIIQQEAAAAFEAGAVGVYAWSPDGVYPPGTTFDGLP